MIACLLPYPGPEGTKHCRPGVCSAAGNALNSTGGCAQVWLGAGEMRI
jgi:hypothetical protein